ncbi:hypothetical protein [Candidatus Burkholderia verschuerenii]|uniref:hypothetical protein n=1 Tax=Candidatus Burkholderia verschuerenii TaxID=242163 RepID=UPI00067DBDF8|nr:hypothetical protein [Candidatus Burkholderia verschuerenii]
MFVFVLASGAHVSDADGESGFGRNPARATLGNNRAAAIVGACQAPGITARIDALSRHAGWL